MLMQVASASNCLVLTSQHVRRDKQSGTSCNYQLWPILHAVMMDEMKGQKSVSILS